MRTGNGHSGSLLLLLQDHEEDPELQELLQQEQELHAQLDGNKFISLNAKDKRSRDECSDRQEIGQTVESKKTGSNLHDLVSESGRLQALTGVKFDMSSFIKKDTGASPKEINSVLNIIDNKARKAMTGKHRSAGEHSHGGKKPKLQELDEESMEETSDSDSDVQETEPCGTCKGKVQSGLYDRPGDTKLVSNE